MHPTLSPIVNHAHAGATRDVKIDEAKAAHETSIERCKAKTGHARKTCMNAADTRLATAKALAESTKANDPST